MCVYDLNVNLTLLLAENKIKLKFLFFALKKYNRDLYFSIYYLDYLYHLCTVEQIVMYSLQLQQKGLYFYLLSNDKLQLFCK